ncbi:hypothetical protein B0H19DRAFT_1277190 [Mycena capillaripes]|nr:hypothetical protein B0H19DRAFT_1277190 [Mycena capillaripes]
MNKNSGFYAYPSTRPITVFVEYGEYNPHRTLDDFFPHCRPPSSFAQITVREPLPVLLALESHPEFTPDSLCVVESTLIALSRLPTHVQVETSEDGRILAVSSNSIRALLSELVAPQHVAPGSTNSLQGIRRYSSSGVIVQLGEGPPASPVMTFLENWVPELVSM